MIYQEKFHKYQQKDNSFLLGVYHFSNGDYQNYFTFQPLYKF